MSLLAFCTPGCIARSIGGSLVNDSASAIFSAFEDVLKEAANWLVNRAMVKITGVAGGTSFDADWFKNRAHAMLTVTVMIMLPMLMVATIGAIVHQDFRRMARTWCVALPVSAIGGGLAMALTNYAMAATDGMCRLVLDGQPPLTGIFHSVVGAALVPANPVFVGYLICGVFIFGAGLIWLELVLRTAAVYIAVFFLPLCLAGLLWPGSVKIAKRMVELLAALILSKFVMVATLSLGAAALTDPNHASGSTAILSGAAILLLAGFAPFALLRLVPIVEAAAIGHLEGMSRRPMQAAGRAATTAAAAPGHPVVAAMRAGQTGKGSGLSPQQVLDQAIPARPAWHTASSSGHGGSPRGGPSAGSDGLPVGPSNGGKGGGAGGPPGGSRPQKPGNAAEEAAGGSHGGSPKAVDGRPASPPAPVGAGAAVNGAAGGKAGRD